MLPSRALDQARLREMSPRTGYCTQGRILLVGILLQQANSGGSGTVASSALESSTVDLAEEFTKMITTQRAYSAAAKIITTADEMLEELIRIRR